MSVLTGRSLDVPRPLFLISLCSYFFVDFFSYQLIQHDNDDNNINDYDNDNNESKTYSNDDSNNSTNDNDNVYYFLLLSVIMILLLVIFTTYIVWRFEMDHLFLTRIYCHLFHFDFFFHSFIHFFP